MNTNEMKLRVLNVAKACFDSKLMVWSSGNMSEFDKQSGIMAITPSAVLYDSMTVEDIVLIDLDGTIVEGKHKPSSEWRMHSGIYMARENVRGIVHTHSPYLTAFSIVHQPIPVVLVEMSAILKGNISTCAFAPNGSPELGRYAAQALENSNVCILNNHGAVAVGKDVNEAHKRAVYAEDAAKSYYLAKNLGQPVVIA